MAEFVADGAEAAPVRETRRLGMQLMAMADQAENWERNL